VVIVLLLIALMAGSLAPAPVQAGGSAAAPAGDAAAGKAVWNEPDALVQAVPRRER